MKEIQVSPWSLLFAPLTLPGDGFRFILETIRDTVNEELYDPDVVRQRLLDLQLRYEMGNVNEDDYEAEWLVLTGRLAEIRAEERESEE
jgi:hypothetical protein